MKKLKLNKKVVASLSKIESVNIKGGDWEGYTDENGRCVIFDTRKDCLTNYGCVVSIDECQPTQYTRQGPQCHVFEYTKP